MSISRLLNFHDEKPNTRRALITGVTGQDGHYLSHLLLKKGYEVAGLVRRTSKGLGPLPKEVKLIPGDMTDSASLMAAVSTFKPTEVYNLAAQSHVGESFDTPITTSDINALGAVRLLEAVRAHAPKARYYQAGTSELFGGHESGSYCFNEKDPFKPRSPYACAKAYAHYATQHYRKAYGLFAVNGILFNHESPMRGEQFVTRKITRAVGRIKAGLQHELKLGDLNPRRDWGYAGDYVRAMWLMLQQPEPDDYVVATGVSHSVKEFAELAFRKAGLKIEDHLVRDPTLLRPDEVWNLRGNAGKIAMLGWEPETSFDDLVEMMVVRDMDLAYREKNQESA